MIVVHIEEISVAEWGGGVPRSIPLKWAAQDGVRCWEIRSRRWRSFQIEGRRQRNVHPTSQLSASTIPFFPEMTFAVHMYASHFTSSTRTDYMPTTVSGPTSSSLSLLMLGGSIWRVSLHTAATVSAAWSNTNGALNS
jgi:hypothetical protein